MKKLSPAQLAVLFAMDGGWELGTISGLRASCWLQDGGCGKGGDVKGVTLKTMNVLSRLSLIEVAARGFPTTTYQLTRSGREQVRDHVSLIAAGKANAPAAPATRGKGKVKR